MFPEGTRSKTGELLKPEAGVALIALKSKAPIVPIAVRGPYKFFKPIKIIIGEPFYLINDDHKLNSQMLQKYSDEIMDKIQNLLDVH